MGRKSVISIANVHAAAERYSPGDVIAARYRLIRPLGEGGMGVVWVAHSIPLDVDVAFKVIAADLAGTNVAERMSQEARAAAKLGHPAMVRVFDFGLTEQGDPYLVMELLLGEDLAQVVSQKGRLSATEAVQTLLPIADGLATAHDSGIVHRDLKPENVFLAHDAMGRVQPKLLDFGLAKLANSDLDRKITATGAVLGSPDYMSPEQAHGRDDIDTRSDIWSFCVLLYESMTGAVPFDAENYNGLMHAIINHPPVPIMAHNAGDSDLWRVLERGFSKDRQERWSSMWELGEALALWLYERGVKEDITQRSLRGSWLESGLSGVQVLVSSTAPPPEKTTDPGNIESRGELPSLGAEVDDLMATLSRPAKIGLPSEDAPVEVAPQAQPQRVRARGGWIVALLVGVAAVLVALVVAFRARPELEPRLTTVKGPTDAPDRTQQATAMDPPSPGSKVIVAGALSATEPKLPESLTQVPAAAESAAEASDAAAEAAPAGAKRVAPRQPATAPAQAAAQRPPPKPTRTAPRYKAAPPQRDFGF
jgi:serine/threonine protein kinase